MRSANIWSRGLGRRVTVLAAAALATLATSADPAGALTTCGSDGQPVCSEAPPPGVTLTLNGPDNPFGLKPLSAKIASDRPLWPRYNGHKPYGFNAIAAGTYGTTAAEEAYLHQQMGASMARVGADWAMIQYFPNTAAGGLPWNYAGYLDPQYRAYVKRGIRPLLMIGRTPRRFTKNAATSANSNVVGCGTSDACWNPPRPEEAGRIATFAADLAKRYPLAAGIEVWNEPNLSNPFWGGEPANPEQYARLLDLVHDAVKRVRSNMPVIGGSLANASTDTTDAQGYDVMSLRTFTRRMLAAGAQADMDAISYHPYLGPYPSWTTDPNVQKQVLFTAMRSSDDQVVAAYQDAGKAMTQRVVITEFGVSTTDGYTPEQQRDWLQMQFALWDADHPNVPLASRTDAAFAHTTVEDPQPPFGNTWQTGFGFTKVKDSTRSFATKPVYCAFRTAFGGFSSCPAAIKLP